MKQLREIERFEAQSRDGAYRTEIIVLQSFIDNSSLLAPAAAPIPGMKQAQTSDGFVCNRISDDEFEVVNDPFHQGLRLYRIRQDSRR